MSFITAAALCVCVCVSEYVTFHRRVHPVSFPGLHPACCHSPEKTGNEARVQQVMHQEDCVPVLPYKEISVAHLWSNGDMKPAIGSVSAHKKPVWSTLVQQV